MADLPISLPSISDIISSIISPPEDSTSSAVDPGPTVTVTVTVVEPPRPTSVSTTAPNNSTSHLSSTSSTHSPNTTTSEPESITTTILSTQGDSVFAVTTVIANPAGHVHAAPSDSTSEFFRNRAAVIGVFTALGIILFASIAAAVACATHRRMILRRRREEEQRSLERRDFFDDEMNDVVEPSDKQWWGNTSGTSIPEPGAIQTAMVPSMPYEPVPASLLLSPTPQQANSEARTSAYSEGATVAHPYATSTLYRTSGSYLDTLTTHSRTISTVTSLTSPSRSTIRSPPPSIPLPPLPPAQLPKIVEGPPSASSDGWVSQIQPAPKATKESIPLTQVGQYPIPASLDRSSQAISHPYASPPWNRRSELYAADVLLDLGEDGGVGRSLSGRKPPVPPVPLPDVRIDTSVGGLNLQLNKKVPLSPFQGESSGNHNTLAANRGDTTSQLSPIHTMRMTPEQSGDASRSNSRAESGAGLSDGGWYDDESASENGKYTNLDPTASHESVLGASSTPHYGYVKAPDHTISAAQRSESKTSINDSSTNLAKRRFPPHDPRYSGLFGVWGDPSSVEDSKHQIGSLDDSHGLQYLRSGVLKASAFKEFEHGDAYS